MVIPVGTVSPLAIVRSVPERSRTTFPLFGPGKPGEPLSSRKYVSPPLTTTATTVVKPGTALVMPPSVLKVYRDALPGAIGNVLRLPTRKPFAVRAMLVGTTCPCVSETSTSRVTTPLGVMESISP
jgi:hypothetical protein